MFTSSWRKVGKVCEILISYVTVKLNIMASLNCSFLGYMERPRCGSLVCFSFVCLFVWFLSFSPCLFCIRQFICFYMWSQMLHYQWRVELWNVTSIEFEHKKGCPSMTVSFCTQYTTYFSICTLRQEKISKL